MAYREFLDPSGVVWKAWDTYPTPAKPLNVAPHLAAGWLTFEGGAKRLRLVPVPADWEHAPESQLQAWLASAAHRSPTRAPTPPPAADPSGPGEAYSAEHPDAHRFVDITRAVVARSRRTIEMIRRVLD